MGDYPSNSVLTDHASNVERRTSNLTFAAAWWENAWAPYDEDTYAAALARLTADDVVLDIGAGDLRFARCAAEKVREVVAIEQHVELLRGAVPPNLYILRGDARRVEFPRGITVGILLMRHCRHFSEYVARLRAVGCKRLITNARWGMDVESVSLDPQPAFDDIPPGWYACLCGAVGFKPAPPESITSASLQQTHSVESCPACQL